MTESATPGDENAAIVPTHGISAAAIRNAVAMWSDSTTNTSRPRRHDIRRDKQNAVVSFFTHVGKDLPDVTPLDVKLWQESLEEKGLAGTTVYYRLCHLSSFYSWAQNHPTI